MPNGSGADKPRQCFLIGPIGGEGTPTRKLADWVLDGLVKPVLEAETFSYTVLRADTDERSGAITDQIIERITDAELVVADLTGLNPNVMYELAICHMVLKPVIHLCHHETVLPFDVKNVRTIMFDISDHAKIIATMERIKRQALDIESEKFVVSNPVTAARKTDELNTSSDSTEQVIARLIESDGHQQRQIDQLKQAASPIYPPPYDPLVEALMARPSLGSLVTGVADRHDARPLSALGSVTEDYSGALSALGSVTEDNRGALSGLKIRIAGEPVTDPSSGTAPTPEVAIEAKASKSPPKKED